MEKILVVDDSRDTADLLSEFLKMVGYDAEAVYSGEAALKAAERLKPRAVILDLGLPDMSGLDVCRRLGNLFGTAKPSLVAMTGWVQVAERKAAEAAGFDYFLPKPADLKDLLGILDELKGPN